MDDNALVAAEAKRAEIAQQIAAQRNAINDAMSRLNVLEHEAAELDSWIDMWHRLAGTVRPPQAAERSKITLPVVKAQKPKRPRNPDRDFVVSEALALIRDKGEPMSRRELFEALSAKGVVIQGKDPEMVLSTMLWRSKNRIVRLVPFGYWPAGERYAPADRLNEEVGKFDL